MLHCRAQFVQSDAGKCVLCGSGELSKIRIPGATVLNQRQNKAGGIYACLCCGNEFFTTDNYCKVCGSPIADFYVDECLNRLVSGNNFASRGRRRSVRSLYGIARYSDDDDWELPF